MRLYYAPGSCALSPHIVAREAGLDIELEKVVFSPTGRTTEPHAENYYEVNPRGYVPALRIEGGGVITEGVAIIQYLADQAPSKNLMPKYQSPEYYRALVWLTFVSTEMHKGFGIFFNKDTTEEVKTAGREKLSKRFEWVNAALEGKEYLLGTFSIADAYCYTILRWSPKANIDLATYPNIAAFMALMAARPAVRQALTEEGLE